MYQATFPQAIPPSLPSFLPPLPPFLSVLPPSLPLSSPSLSSSTLFPTIYPFLSFPSSLPPSPHLRRFTRTDPGYDRVGKISKDGSPMTILDIATQGDQPFEGPVTYSFCTTCEVSLYCSLNLDMYRVANTATLKNGRCPILLCYVQACQHVWLVQAKKIPNVLLKNGRLLGNQ